MIARGLKSLLIAALAALVIPSGAGALAARAPKDCCGKTCPASSKAPCCRLLPGIPVAAVTTALRAQAAVAVSGPSIPVPAALFARIPPSSPLSLPPARPPSLTGRSPPALQA